MKARIPKHREFVIDLENTAEEKVKALQQEYGFAYTIELK